MKEKYNKRYEEQVRRKFCSWLKKHHSRWFISKKNPIKVAIPTKEISFRMDRLSPDIDVLAYCKASDKLISYEVKGPTRKYKDHYIIERNGKMVGSQAYKGDLGKLQKGNQERYKIEKISRPHYPDFGITYKGIGEALFNLRYVDQSFLVLPEVVYLSHFSHPVFLNILLDRLLPLGLIKYDYYLHVKDNKLDIKEFEVIRKAKDSSLWKRYNESLKRESDIIEFEYEGEVRRYLKNKLEKGEL